VPLLLVEPDPSKTRIAVVTLTLLAAWATKVLVEDPVRRSAWLSAQPRMTFAFSGAATALIAGVLVGGATHVQAQIHEAERESGRLLEHNPRCFGAAARDALRRCENPDLRLKVIPQPVAAKTEQYARCDDFRQERGISICDFGVPRERAKRTFALVGDSHASHWRGPLAAVARARGWRGRSIARTSCPFSTATKHTPQPTRSRCVRWVSALPRFLRAHPEVDTLFVVGLTGGVVNVPAGRTMFEAKVNGFRRAWQTLPASVQHIVVIRDTPKIFRSTVDCIDRAIAERRRPGLACAVPRRASLDSDPQIVAAHEERSRRVQAVDLASVLCSRRLCFPVIGGVLVYKDLHHFTLVFVKTLGHPLVREVDRIAQSW
jgi:hypothetical protein